MNIFHMLPAILSIIGAIAAVLAFIINIVQLRERLKVERKLAHNLALSLKRKGLDSRVSFELNKLTVTGTVNKEEIEKFKENVQDSLEEAIKELIEDERTVIRNSLEQPSQQGQYHYLRKLVSNSLEQSRSLS